MAGNGREDGLILHAPLGAGQNGGADAVPHRGRALFAALGVFGVRPHDGPHLVLGDLLGRVVQQRRQRGLLFVGPIVLRQLDGPFLHVQGVLIALIAQAAAHKLFCLFQSHSDLRLLLFPGTAPRAG